MTCHSLPRPSDFNFLQILVISKKISVACFSIDKEENDVQLFVFKFKIIFERDWLLQPKLKRDRKSWEKWGLWARAIKTIVIQISFVKIHINRILVFIWKNTKLKILPSHGNAVRQTNFILESIIFRHTFGSVSEKDDDVSGYFIRLSFSQSCWHTSISFWASEDQKLYGVSHTRVSFYKYNQAKDYLITMCAKRKYPFGINRQKFLHRC